MLFLVICAFISLHSSVLANPTIDSLRKELNTVENDSVKVDILNSLTFLEVLTHPEKSQGYNNDAINLSKSIAYHQGEANAYDMRGILYRKSGFFEEAVKDHLKSEKINAEIGNQNAIATNLSNVGMVYLEQNLHSESIQYFLQALKLKSSIPDSSGMIFTYNDLTTAYIGLGNYDSALFYSQQALRLSYQLNQHSFEVRALFNIAKVHSYDHNFEMAKVELQNVIDRSIEVDNNYVLAKAYKLLSDIYRFSKEFDKSVEYGLMSLEVSRNSNLAIDAQEALMSISRAYAQLEDFENAYKYQRMYLTFTDSVYDSKSEQRSMLLASKYEFETQQRLMQAEYDGQIAQQRLIMLIAGGMILTMIIIFLLVIRKNRLLGEAYSKIELANKDIENQKEEIEQQKEKIHIQADKLIHVNASKDQVFNIISHDLRGPIESLNSLLDLVTSNDITQSDFKTFSSHLQEKVRGLAYTLNNLLIWSRSQMTGLSVAPKEIDLYPILKNKIMLFSQMARVKEIELKLKAKDGITAFADEDQVRMVLRNLMNNAIKFTKKGGLIEIIAEDKDEKIVVSVKDNGIGIKKEDQKKLFNSSNHFTTYGTSGEKGTGIGLLLCKEIIEKNGGELKLESLEGEGSTFSFTLPKLFIEN